MPRQSIKVVRTCEICGEKFLFKVCPSRGPGRGRFCSRLCGNRWKSKARVVPFADKFFALIGRKTDRGCILWAGNTNANGYGILHGEPPDTRMVIASRAAYELMVGPISDGLFVLHRCDTPPCINPVHLFLGTTADNMTDKTVKERGNTTKLTAGKVREIRVRLDAGESHPSLAAAYRVSNGTIWFIAKGLTWKHVV